MKRIGSALVVFLSVIWFSGCVHYRVIDYTLISTKNHKLSLKTPVQRVTGKACSPLFFPSPSKISFEKDAIDQALAVAGPEYNLLADVVVTAPSRNRILARNCFTVEGTPVNLNELIAKQKPQ